MVTGNLWLLYSQISSLCFQQSPLTLVSYLFVHIFVYLCFNVADKSQSATGSEASDQKPRSSLAPSPLRLSLHPAGDWRRIWGSHKPRSSPRFKIKKVHETANPWPPRPYLWLMADGRHRNMMAKRTMENRKRQKASLIHSSFQSCRQMFSEGVKVKDRGQTQVTNYT